VRLKQGFSVHALKAPGSKFFVAFGYYSINRLQNLDVAIGARAELRVVEHLRLTQ